MKNYYFSLVLALFALFALLSACTTNAEVGDRQILMAFNAAYHEVVASGEYDAILEKWGVDGFEHDECSPDSSPLNQWPENPEGIFKTILVQSKVIAMVHYINGFPPFWNGSAGLEDDLADAVIRRIADHYNAPDLKKSWVPATISPNGYFESLYQNLENLGSDLILANMGITPDRRQYVDFSCAYLYVYHCVVRSGLDPQLTLTTVEMLNKPGIKVAVQKGTYFENLAETNLTQASVYVEKDLYATLSLVADEEVHAALTAEPFVVGWRPSFISTEGNTLQNVTIYRYGAPQPIGAAFRKEDDQSSDSGAASSIAKKSIVLLVAVILASVVLTIA